jgi:hypothetical protein
MFVLSEQLHSDGNPQEPWDRYRRYLERNRTRFPASAYRIASGVLNDGAFASWPHDASLVSAIFTEPGINSRRDKLSLRVRLLGRNRDRFLEFFYPKVFSYQLTNSRSAAGHFDWRYSEMRLNKAGQVVHEIEWAGPPGASAHWIIESSDVRFRAIRKVNSGNAA